MSTIQPVPANARKRFYLLHRWTGLVVAFAGMLVFFSGAVATFHEELDSWSSRGQRFASVSALPSFDLDTAFDAAAQNVEPRLLESVDISQAPGYPLSFFFHEHIPDGMKIKEVGAYVELDPATLSVVRRRDGEASQIMAASAPHALAEFFIHLHFYLLLPETLGLIVTGVCGFALLTLVVTGIWVHRPSQAKLLRRPRQRRPRLFMGDLHTLLGSWTLPYTLILSLTGAFFSFAGAVLIPVVALVAFGGNQEELIRTVVGSFEVSKSDTRASLDDILKDSQRRTQGGQFQRLGLDQWGKPGATATVSVVVPATLGDESHNYVYDGHTAGFLQEKPDLGTRPSLGNSLLGLFGDLHFGTLLGTLTRLLWGVLGLATCALAATGLIVFVTRQQEQHAGATRIVRLVTVALAGGLPLAAACACLAWIASVAGGVTAGTLPMTLAFIVATAGAGVVGAWLPLRPALVSIWGAAGICLVLVPLLAPLATGVGPFAAWASPALRETTAVDVALLGLGGLLLWASLRFRRVAAGPSPKRAIRHSLASG